MAKNLVFLMGIFLLTSCGTTSTTGTTPSLQVIYDRTAKYQGVDRNPVIVIPGIMGSKLIDQVSQRTVWGGFGQGYIDPKDPDDIRLVALPIDGDTAIDKLEDTVVPDGVLETLDVNLHGLPLILKAYYNIMRALGVVGGYIDEQVDSELIDYGGDHFTCFQFAYDWRKDVSYNAKKLSEFIQEKREQVAKSYKKQFNVSDTDIKFDIVAHSMGGLIARYYLMYGDADLTNNMEATWEGTKHVSSATLVGTPNAGSLDVLDDLVNGLNFSIFLPTFSPAIVGTIPAVYQLLPRNRHKMLYESDTGLPLDPLSYSTWEKYNWGLLDPEEDQVLQSLLPQVSTREERREIAKDFIKKVLDRTKMLHEALDRPASVPHHFKLNLYAGDSMLTPSQIMVGNDGKISVSEKKPGDGVVLRSSALMDERVGSDWSPALVTPIDWSNVTFIFEDHLGLVESPIFIDNILYFLMERPVSTHTRQLLN